jgi:hypothetical protein
MRKARELALERAEAACAELCRRRVSAHNAVAWFVQAHVHGLEAGPTSLTHALSRVPCSAQLESHFGPETTHVTPRTAQVKLKREPASVRPGLEETEEMAKAGPYLHCNSPTVLPFRAYFKPVLSLKPLKTPAYYLNVVQVELKRA